jgi:hypothetical protein
MSGVNMTRGRRCNQAGLLILLVMGATLGCVRTPAPLDLTSSDPFQDQWKIAGYYRHEAALFRTKADELSQRTAVYERLFGADSEWVTGARLLAQFYEDAALEQERLASLHLGIARHERQAPLVGSATP